MLLTLAVLAFADTPPSPGHYQATVKLLNIRAEPRSAAPEVGKLAQSESFAVSRVTDGPGCRSGWGEVGDNAWTCLDHARPSEQTPVSLPRNVEYEPPFPTDYLQYSESGEWFTRHTGENDLLPFIYARRWKHWRGRVYATPQAYAAGDAPVSRLPAGRRARFVDAIATDAGLVLVKEDGTVVPEEDVYVFPITRFQGRDLREDPLPDGHLLAWSTHYADAPVYPDSTLGEPALRVAYHQAFVVDAIPVREHVWRAPNALGMGVDGYVDDRTDVRIFHPTAPPEEIEGNERWIDIDRDGTTLAMYEGATPIYATLVSPGTGTRTPLGTWRIQDKRVWHDMKSAVGSDDPYYVEAVPWTMFFKPLYAIHAAYWHWGFGHKASHGCINVSPRDARFLFENSAPELPVGWHTINADDETLPGTLVRIH